VTAVRTAADWTAWLDRAGLDRVVVVSPHPDDAVFSLAGFLQAAPARTEVLTLFTAAVPGPVTDWARATGFADNEAEAQARRAEDARAMNRLGCRFRHAGLVPGEDLAPKVPGLVRQLAADHPAGLARTLVLLPAGAGAPPPPGWVQWLRRAVRRPSGAPPHGEHVQTRDHWWRALTAGAGVRVGFYAELPYAWAHSHARLQAHLAAALGVNTERVAHRPSVDDKARLVDLYASQATPILGAGAYRRRVLAREECLFIAPGG
jgi:LmbE family N-acetylglucosaminyl deacetylase